MKSKNDVQSHRKSLIHYFKLKAQTYNLRGIKAKKDSGYIHTASQELKQKKKFELPRISISSL